MAELGFDGKVAIITGAGGGLGRQHALALAPRGALVVVNDLGGAVDGSGSDAGAAQQVVDEIKAAGGEAVADTNSVATPEGGEAIVQTAIDAFGRSTSSSTTPASCATRRSTTWTPDLLDPVLDVHLKGAFNVTKPAWIRMREQGYGRVVSTSSAAGIFGNFGQTNYGAAKMGLVGLTRVLAVEGARYGIQANAIAPLALTRMTEDIMGALGEKLDPALDHADRRLPRPRVVRLDRADLLRAAAAGSPRCSSPRPRATTRPTSRSRTWPSNWADDHRPRGLPRARQPRRGDGASSSRRSR